MSKFEKGRIKITSKVIQAIASRWYAPVTAIVLVAVGVWAFVRAFWVGAALSFVWAVVLVVFEYRPRLMRRLGWFEGREEIVKSLRENVFTQRMKFTEWLDVETERQKYEKASLLGGQHSTREKPLEGEIIESPLLREEGETT